MNHFPQAPARNNQYWICIRGERERYESLVDAIMKDTEIEGGYVVEYDEYTEQGELYARFFLRDTDDEPPYFLLAPDCVG